MPEFHLEIILIQKTEKKQNKTKCLQNTEEFISMIFNWYLEITQPFLLLLLISISPEYTIPPYFRIDK